METARSRLLSDIRSFYFGRPRLRPGITGKPLFKKGLLVFLVGLFLAMTVFAPFTSTLSSSDFVLVGMLLLHHLSMNFWFGRKITPTLRILFTLWIVGGFIMCTINIYKIMGHF